MDTPICNFVQNYIKSSPLRLHMPGHKGLPLLGFEERDITEIDGADVLYQPHGIIRESERNAETLWGTARTVYSAEGSSLSIRAMLYLLRLHTGGEQLRICAGRNAHKVFVSAAALLGAKVRWLYPRHRRDLCSCELTPEDLEAALSQGEKPHAVYITSPDYLGHVADIRGLARVCHAHGVLLAVDNAHGAYLRFLEPSRHPMDLGADLCCDSAHKTLPVVTGGGYLHVSKQAPAEFAESADRAMAMFASTSPSYLILQSLDAANAFLADGCREKLARAAALWDGVKAELRGSGWDLEGEEPMKLTLRPKARGYTGDEVARRLEEDNMPVEFYDPDYVVLLLSPQWGEQEAARLLAALKAIPARTAILSAPPTPPTPQQAMEAEKAIFAPCEMVPTEKSLGRTMSSPTVSCPPAVPIVACGEQIDEQAVKAMEYYGIETVCVVRE